MTDEQLAELKSKLAPKGRDFVEGYATAVAAMSRRLDEDRQTIEPPERSLRALHEYLSAMVPELADEAEALRA
ncbi:MAG TPA: hypothetical protein VMY40_14890 [Anaerolineae bacterium]|nr:hypothetical protein [Anaerolineae bacterium]